MRLSLLLALLLSPALHAAPRKPPAPSNDLPCGEGCTSWDSPQQAFARVLAAQPELLAVGEVHEVEGASKRVKSAIKRFTQLMLPALKGKASHLVVETWITSGRCGEVEKQASAQVQKVTRRPAQTENEVLTLMKSAYDLGITQHILTLECEEYRSMLQADGEMDPGKTLLLVKDKMAEKALKVRAKESAAAGRRMVVLYGGAVHNDVAPSEGFKEYSFAAELGAAAPGKYLELDLYVPEYIEKDDDLKKEPWFAEAMQLSAKGRTVLLHPRAATFLLVFPRTR